MKNILIAMMVVSVILFTSCQSTVSATGEPGLKVELVERDFEVLGHVSVSGAKKNVLGLFWWGGVTYEELLEEARKMGADDVMNIYEDKSLTTFAIFYNSFGHTFTATAIKYK